jgi:hypothetical protein
MGTLLHWHTWQIRLYGPDPAKIDCQLLGPFAGELLFEGIKILKLISAPVQGNILPVSCQGG